MTFYQQSLIKKGAVNLGWTLISPYLGTGQCKIHKPQKAIISIVFGLSISHKFKQNQTLIVDSVHFSQNLNISVPKWDERCFAYCFVLRRWIFSVQTNTRVVRTLHITDLDMLWTVPPRTNLLKYYFTYNPHSIHNLLSELTSWWQVFTWSANG